MFDVSLVLLLSSHLLALYVGQKGAMLLHRSRLYNYFLSDYSSLVCVYACYKLTVK